jgi:hypothetical protein
MKMRSVCCNRDIAKTRTEVPVDWVPELETRAHRIRVGELIAVRLDWLVQLKGGW